MTTANNIAAQPDSAAGLTQQASAASPRAALATIAQIADALDALCQVCEGSDEAMLIDQLTPTIVFALCTTIEYRQAGQTTPSEYDGWWQVRSEISDRTKQAADLVCEQVRLQ
jgi:hypothetical protein